MVLPLLVVGAVAYWGYGKVKKLVAPKRILVFGFSHSGKTSLVNALTSSSHPVSTGPRGSTIENTKTTINRFNDDYEFWDTPGLNDFASEQLSEGKALESLVDLMRKTSEGLNLLILVVKRSELFQKNTKTYYDLVVKRLTDHKIPIILVVTNCEEEIGTHLNYGDAATKMFSAVNGEVLESGMTFKDHLGCTFGAKVPQQIKNLCASEVWKLIRLHTLPISEKYYENSFLSVPALTKTFERMFFSPTDSHQAAKAIIEDGVFSSKSSQGSFSNQYFGL